MVRIMLADSHADVRKQLAERLSREKDFEIVGQASTAAEMLERIHASRPDVLVVDPDVRGEDYIDALKNLRFQLPHIRVVVLASVVDTFLQVELTRVGVDRILNKGIRTDALLQAILDMLDSRPKQ